MIKNFWTRLYKPVKIVEGVNLNIKNKKIGLMVVSPNDSEVINVLIESLKLEQVNEYLIFKIMGNE